MVSGGQQQLGALVRVNRHSLPKATLSYQVCITEKLMYLKPGDKLKSVLCMLGFS